MPAQRHFAALQRALSPHADIRAIFAAPPKSFISIIFALRFITLMPAFSAAIFRGWLLAFAISTVIFLILLRCIAVIIFFIEPLAITDATPKSHFLTPVGWLMKIAAEDIAHIITDELITLFISPLY
jgi:hypothetical protein